MTDQPAAAKLEQQAFEHWNAGRLGEAADLFAQALASADPTHPMHAHLHGAFAGVLDAQERVSEARAYRESAVEVARRLNDGDDFCTEVSIARYFLADHLVRRGSPVLALEAIAPSLPRPTKSEWLLRLVEAEALVALGRIADARTAAKLSVAKAPSAEKRAELAHRFAAIISEHGPTN